MKNFAKNFDKKIAIIGAGSAGLTAAESLKSLGYKNITVLEKSERAGGKCCSIQYQGRAYELGAGMIAGCNRTVLELAKKYAVKMNRLDPVDFSECIFVNTKQSFKNKLRMLPEVILKYLPLARRYKKITAPGLQDVDSDLCMPFHQWAVQHKIPLLAQEFAVSFTGFGYGYLDEVPAAYVLKYFSFDILKSFLKKDYYEFADGIQELWSQVAKNHTVLYNTHVQKIRRTQDTSAESGVRVQTADRELKFDSIILACPLDESLQYLDASEEEKTLFSKISYCDYRTYTCFLKNFPNRHGFVPKNFNSARKGYPVMWYQRFHDSNLYAFYILGDWKISDEEAQKNIRDVVEKLGGTIENFHTSVHWKYFPHVSQEEMKNGYFDQLEAMQGCNNTYYAGELLNFSTVNFSAEYSQKLVERCF